MSLQELRGGAVGVTTPEDPRSSLSARTERQQRPAYALGVDPSLTGTGVARITSDGRVFVAHFGRKGSRGETLAQRADRIDRLSSEVAQWIAYDGLSADEGGLFHGWDAPEIAVIEGPSHGSAGGSAWDRAYLWWELVRVAIPDRVAIVAPPTRAKWATGSGRADKAAVAHAVGRLWPDVPIDCSDCADALALATCGAQHLGWDVPTLQRHRDALTAVRWPETVEAA